MADPNFNNSLTYIDVLIETTPGSDTYTKPCGLDGRTFTRNNEPFETQFAACSVGQAGNRVRAEGLDDWSISGSGTMTLDAFDVFDEWKSGGDNLRGPRKIVILGYTGSSNNLTQHVHYIGEGLLNSLSLPQGANNELVTVEIEIGAANGKVERVVGAFTGTIEEAGPEV